MSTPKKYPEANPTPPEQSQVAESVASYVISPSAATATRAAKTRRIAGLEAPDEVWAFAQKHRLVPHLETTVRLANELFHDIRKTYLTFEPDPEIPSLDGIAVNIKVGGTLDELIQQDSVFGFRFAQEIPNDVSGKISLLVWGA